MGPDGFHFWKEQQSVRLQYADNIDLKAGWMIGVWIKTFYGVPSPRNETILTQGRFDNRNDTPYTFSFGLMSNPGALAKTGIRFSAFLYDPVAKNWPYVQFNF